MPHVRLAPSRRRAAAGAAPAGASARRGFTIVETIVSLMMLAVGVLAMVSSSAVVLNQMNYGQKQAVAASLAAERIEQFRSYDLCASITAGSGNRYGMTESWTVAAVAGTGGQASRTVTYRVTYRGGGMTRTATFITNIPCV